MRPTTRNDNSGRTRAVDDIHHRTADTPRAGARKVARMGDALPKDEFLELMSVMIGLDQTIPRAVAR